MAEVLAQEEMEMGEEFLCLGQTRSASCRSDRARIRNRLVFRSLSCGLPFRTRSKNYSPFYDVLGVHIHRAVLDCNLGFFPVQGLLVVLYVFLLLSPSPPSSLPSVSAQ